MTSYQTRMSNDSLTINFSKSLGLEKSSAQKGDNKPCCRGHKIVKTKPLKDFRG